MDTITRFNIARSNLTLAGVARQSGVSVSSLRRWLSFKPVSDDIDGKIEIWIECREIETMRKTG
jgi:hypothetical protein